MFRVPPRRPRLLVAALTTLVASLALTGVASATRSPTDAELTGMQSVLLADCTLHQQGCTWNGGLVSDVDAEFGFASMTGATGPYDAIVFRNDDVSADWTVLVVLTPQTTCSDLQERVPAQALDDLEIKGLSAGSTQAITCGKPAATPKSCTSVRVASARAGISVLGMSCTKARSIVSRALKNDHKAPSGYTWVNADQCSSFVVTKKNRKVEHPLVELSARQPVIFVDDLTSSGCIDEPTSP